MSTDPNQIRADIERTRYELSRDVDTLGDRVRPSSVAHRQTDRVREGMARVRERVMGATDVAGDTAAELGDRMRDASAGVGAGVQETAGRVRDAVEDVPDRVRSTTQGDPLAAGLVAFGLGLLAASLAPPSRPEAQAAQRLREVAEPAIREAKEAARSVADDLREPAREQVQALRESAMDAGTEVSDHAREAAARVAQHGQDAATDVFDDRGV